MESKSEAKKKLICSRSRESNTSVDAQQIIVTNTRNENLRNKREANMRNRIKQKLLYHVRICSKFRARALYINNRRFVCHI